MNRKKMLPLVLLAAGAVLLGVLLAVLTCENEAEEDTGIPLVDFAAEDVDELAYSGNNVDVTLLKGSEGNWMLDSDPTLPLEQSAVQSLVEKFTDLTAARQLQDSELGEIPAMSDTPAMVFTLKAGKMTRTLTVDQLNDVAGVYYVYDDGRRVHRGQKRFEQPMQGPPQPVRGTEFDRQDQRRCDRPDGGRLAVRFERWHLAAGR